MRSINFYFYSHIKCTTHKKNWHYVFTHIMQGLSAETKNNLCFRSTVSYPGWGRDTGKFTPETHLERKLPSHGSSFACSFYSIASPSPIPSPPNPASDFVHVHVCVSEDACYPKDYFQSLVFLKGLSAGRLYTWKIDGIRCIQLFKTDLSVTSQSCYDKTHWSNARPAAPDPTKTHGKTYVRKHI